METWGRKIFGMWKRENSGKEKCGGGNLLRSWRVQSWIIHIPMEGDGVFTMRFCGKSRNTIDSVKENLAILLRNHNLLFPGIFTFRRRRNTLGRPLWNRSSDRLDHDGWG
jgi:hypothetical protein